MIQPVHFKTVGTHHARHGLLTLPQLCHTLPEDGVPFIRWNRLDEGGIVQCRICEISQGKG